MCGGVLRCVTECDVMLLNVATWSHVLVVLCSLADCCGVCLRCM